MSKLEEFHYTFHNPQLTGDEDLSGLQAVISPHPVGRRFSERPRVRASAHIDGWPGYMRHGGLTASDAIAYASSKMQRDIDGQHPPDQRHIGIYTSVDGRNELAGMAIYAPSAPQLSLVTGRKQPKTAYVETFVIANCIMTQEFTPSQLESIGVVLGYAALRDMRSERVHGRSGIFGKLSYHVEDIIRTPFLRIASTLGVIDELEPGRELPPVSQSDNVPGLTRHEYIIETAVLMNALRQQYGWLEGGAA